MGCCARKANSWTVAIMVYTIVQSICSVIWQIYQIMLYENFVYSSSSGNALLEAIKFVYYFHIKGPYEYDLHSDESSRVNILAIAHLTADIFWIFTSIIALSVKSKKNAAYGVNIFWMCIAVIELIIDVTSVALFANDAISWQNSHLLPREFYAGAILMAIVSARFILPLLVNVCMFFGLVSITKALKRPPMHQYHQQHHQQTPGHIQHRIVPLKPAMRTPRPPHLQEQDLSRVNNWYNHYDDPIRIPRNPNDGQLREGPNEHHQRRYELLQPQNLPPMRHQNVPQILVLAPQNLPMSPKQFPYRPQTAPQTSAGELPRQDLDAKNWYNVYDDMQPAQHLPRVKNDGRLHRRQQEEDEDLVVEYPRGGTHEDVASELSFNDHQNFVGDHTNVMVNGVPSGTLRRQLPWSYVHEPGMFPRKQTRDLTVEAPPVPVPDYTMRYNRNQRPDLDSWSQPSTSPGVNNH